MADVVTPATGRIDPAAWHGRRVFVTGHTGFKGGWLCQALRRYGADVTGFALAPSTAPSLFDAAGVGKLVRDVRGDIRDLAALTEALAAADPDVVFHLAAQPIVRQAFADPLETFSTNVMGTVHLLEAVRRTPSVRAVIAVTSDKVYDNVEWPWPYRETDRLGGREPYGASKACCEIVTEAYRSSYGRTDLGVATVRAGNIVGGGDWSMDRLVPDAMRAFSTGAPLIVRNPAAVRPWQHVLEPVLGYMLLAERLMAGDKAFETAWNFGPPQGDARTVGDIVDALIRLWGGDARWEPANDAQPYEARLLTVDNSLAVGRLKWRPRWTLDTALERTVEWYRAFYGGQPMADITARQIEDFLDV